MSDNNFILERGHTIDDIDSYDEYLDEVCEMVKIGNLEYYPSTVLKAVDPIAYCVGLQDYRATLEDEEEEDDE